MPELIPAAPLVRAQCEHCGNETFAIYFDPTAQAYHTECAECGTVAFNA